MKKMHFSTHISPFESGFTVVLFLFKSVYTVVFAINIVPMLLDATLKFVKFWCF